MANTTTENGTLGSYKISAGSKLSYGALGTGGAFPSSWTELVGCTEIPEIGSAPDNVDSTTLDNLKYNTAVPALIDLGTLDFPFNMEIAQTGANINVIAGLDEATVYGWKVAYSTGVTVQFKSKPRYSFDAVGVNAIQAFTLHLTPEDGLTITVPTTSA